MIRLSSFLGTSKHVAVRAFESDTLVQSNANHRSMYEFKNAEHEPARQRVRPR
jgi:hypothetical protein